MLPDERVPSSTGSRESGSGGWGEKQGTLLREAHARDLPPAAKENAAFARLEGRLRELRTSDAAKFPRERGARWWRLRLTAGAVASVLLGFSVTWFVSRSPAVPVSSPAEVAAAASSLDSHRHRLEPGAPAVRLEDGKTELVGEAVVRVAKASDVTVRASARDVMVVLARGRVALQVRHRHEGDRVFTVSAGVFEFRVLGTAFEVEHGLGSATGLDVREGLVAVLRDGQLIAKVGAGQSWREPSPSPEGAPSSAGEVAGEVVAAAAVPPTAVKVSSSRRLSHGARHEAAARGPSALAAAAGLAEPASSGGLATTLPSSSDASGSLAGPSSRRGSCLALETSAHVKEAVSCYEALGRGPGVSAEASLYQAALLRRDSLRDAPGALAAFREYQQRFPRGLLTVEVGLSIAELLPRLGRYAEALTETDQLFAQGAGRERRTELLLLRGRILFEGLRDNERAEASFAEAATGAGDAAVEAMYFRGLCLQKLGRRDEARAAFTSYVGRGHSAKHLRDARVRLGLSAP